MNQINFNSQQFTIQQASEKLIISKPTLQFWEKEIEDIIVPLRTPGGQRRYMEEHFLIISNIKKLGENGKGTSEIREQLTNHNMENSTSNNADIAIPSERLSHAVIEEISKFYGEKAL